MKICIVQHFDADGYSAAYLVYKYLKPLNLETKFYVMSYDEKEVEDFLKEVEKDDRVYIVDYSLKPAKMIELLKITKNVTWIDHHRTAISAYDDWSELIEEATGIDRIPGIRLEGLCGAALTYLYLYEGWTDSAIEELKDCSIDSEEMLQVLRDGFKETAPRWLQLTNDWDVWDLQMLPDSKRLQIATQGDLSIELYEELDGDDFEDILTTYLCKGESYLEYRDMWARKFRKTYGYSKMLTFGDRTYSVYLLNIENINSDFYGPEIFNYDICMNYCYRGKDVKFSLYSQTPGVDCGAIARLFGGGGHPGAAGFSTSLSEAINFIS